MWPARSVTIAGMARFVVEAADQQVDTSTTATSTALTVCGLLVAAASPSRFLPFLRQAVGRGAALTGAIDLALWRRVARQCLTTRSAPVRRKPRGTRLLRAAVLTRGLLGGWGGRRTGKGAGAGAATGVGGAGLAAIAVGGGGGDGGGGDSMGRTDGERPRGLLDAVLQATARSRAGAAAGARARGDGDGDGAQRHAAGSPGGHSTGSGASLRHAALPAASDGALRRPKGGARALLARMKRRGHPSPGSTHGASSPRTPPVAVGGGRGASPKR